MYNCKLKISPYLNQNLTSALKLQLNPFLNFKKSMSFIKTKRFARHKSQKYPHNKPYKQNSRPIKSNIATKIRTSSSIARKIAKRDKMCKRGCSPFLPLLLLPSWLWRWLFCCCWRRACWALVLGKSHSHSLPRPEMKK